MHFKANLEIYNKKDKLINERNIFVRSDNITGVLDVIRKIRGAKWRKIDTIDLNEYLLGIKNISE